MNICTGIAHNVLLISARRPLLFISWPFHSGKRSATLSRMGCSADLCSLVTDRGNPKYFIGKSSTMQGKNDFTSSISSGAHLIGATWHFATLQESPDAPSKMCKIRVIACRSDCTGERNITRSSAYSDTRCGTLRTQSPCSSGQLSARQINALRTSMTMRKSIGESGSP